MATATAPTTLGCCSPAEKIVHRTADDRHIPFISRLPIGRRVRIDADDRRFGAHPEPLHQLRLPGAQAGIGHGGVVRPEQKEILDSILNHFQAGKQRADLQPRQMARIGIVRLQVLEHRGIVGGRLNQLGVFLHLRRQALLIPGQYAVDVILIPLQDHHGVQQAGQQDHGGQHDRDRDYKARELPVRDRAHVFSLHCRLIVTLKMRSSMPCSRNSCRISSKHASTPSGAVSIRKLISVRLGLK